MRIREATSSADFETITKIQREVWNVQDIEIVGHIHLKASQHAGGSVLVAESDMGGELLGFSYAFPSYVHGEAFWHSDMLAVLPAFRGGEVGQKLKWAQREHALRSGIRRITWTFDPMQAGNAHLNLELLGVTARAYLPNFYGITTSALHHGLPTDRLLASWDLESPQVVSRSRAEPTSPPRCDGTVSVPGAWNDLVRTDLERARGEQSRVAAEIQTALREGLVIAGFDKNSSSYLLTRTGTP